MAGTPGPRGDIFLMHADGSGKRRLTHDPADDYQPQWVPDGRISFVRSWNGHEQVMIMNVDGSAERALGTPSNVEPIWRPRGV